MHQAQSSRHQKLKRHPINMKLTYTIPSNDPSRQKQLNENLNYPFFVYGNRSIIKAISKLVWGHVRVSLFLSSDMVDTNSDLYQSNSCTRNFFSHQNFFTPYTSIQNHQYSHWKLCG